MFVSTVINRCVQVISVFQLLEEFHQIEKLLEKNKSINSISIMKEFTEEFDQFSQKLMIIRNEIIIGTNFLHCSIKWMWRRWKKSMCWSYSWILFTRASRLNAFICSRFASWTIFCKVWMTNSLLKWSTPMIVEIERMKFFNSPYLW